MQNAHCLKRKLQHSWFARKGLIRRILLRQEYRSSWKRPKRHTWRSSHDETEVSEREKKEWHRHMKKHQHSRNWLHHLQNWPKQEMIVPVSYHLLLRVTDGRNSRKFGGARSRDRRRSFQQSTTWDDGKWNLLTKASGSTRNWNPFDLHRRAQQEKQKGWFVPSLPQHHQQRRRQTTTMMLPRG